MQRYLAESTSVSWVYVGRDRGGVQVMTQNATEMLDRIAKGSTDLAVDYVAQGGAAGSVDRSGLMGSCAYYGDLTAIKYLMSLGDSVADLQRQPHADGVLVGHLVQPLDA